MARPALDTTDRQLLAALRQNARASLVSLARDIGLSRSATHDRIVRLEGLGVIKRYTIEVDSGSLPPIRAFLTVSFQPGASSNATAQTISAFDHVRTAHCLSGDIDMLIYCEAEHAEALGALRDRIATLDGVLEIRTRQILATAEG